MCGIAGIWYWDGRRVSPDELSTMIAVMHHRGPDDAGIYLDGSLGLGHRRLSIIDLSSAGHQPMANEDEALWLTYNGEIYNYRELLPSLLAQGHRFRSRTDSEVILHAFESYGVECVHQFNSRRSRERGLLNTQALEQLLEHEQPFGRVVWGVLCLELWYQEFVDAK